MIDTQQLTWYVVPIIIALSIFILAVLLEYMARKNISIKKLIEVLKRGAFLSVTILSIVTGILFIFAATQNYLFAPALGFDNSLLHTVLRIAEAVIGVGLILAIFTRLMTVGILALYIAAFFTFNILDVLDYSIFAGISAFLFLVHRDALSFSFFFHPLEKKELFDGLRKYALPILRFITGMTLAYAAFYHNILDSQSAIAFINQKPALNIMQSLFGIENYSNYWLVIHAGIFSILTGILLALGLLKRIVSTIVATGLILVLLISGISFLPIIVPYFAVIYIIITGNQFIDEKKPKTKTKKKSSKK